MNWLSSQQNDAGALRWIAASSDRYGRAKRLLFIQVCIGVLIPLALSIAKIAAPQISGWTAFYGVVVTILDLALLDRSHKQYMKQGALAQECFDCEVLRFDWNDDRAGTRPTQADAVAWSLDYLRRQPDQSNHIDWYPTITGEIPITYGRLICQLSNCRWDARLRRRYAAALFGTVLTLGLGVTIVSLVRRTTLEDFFLTISSLLPVIVWALRNWKTQTEVIESVEEQRKRVESLWAKSLRGELGQSGIEQASRALQDDIFSRRKGSQPIFNWIYRRFRAGDEIEMKRVAEAMVEEYRRSSAAIKPSDSA